MVARPWWTEGGLLVGAGLERRGDGSDRRLQRLERCRDAAYVSAELGFLVGGHAQSVP